MMILLTLALLAAPATLPPQRRVHHAKPRSARVTRVVRPRPLLATAPAVPDRNAKYRVAGTDDGIDFKTRVVERGVFKDCGVTGMPVCPSKGMPIVHSETQ